MTDERMRDAAGDPHDLGRFVRAQRDDYDRALAELRDGRKRSHWMWYVFPQFVGLGRSATAERYAIRSVAEARAYLRHAVLGPRLAECAEAALCVAGRSARDVFGSPDDLKLRSCATLFACLSPAGSVFDRLLDRYFDGAPDPSTLGLLLGALRAERGGAEGAGPARAGSGDPDAPRGALDGREQLESLREHLNRRRA